MVGIKFSSLLAVASVAVKLASAGECEAIVSDQATNVHTYALILKLDGKEIAQQDSDSNHDLDIYGSDAETLSADELGGDVLFWATRNSNTFPNTIKSCRGEFMDQKFDGKVGETGTSCSMKFKCTVD